jgi:glycosyltransferase involved in cell wall biosynthesis
MSQMQSLDDPCSDRSEPLSHDRGENILITVLMPCLNESRTLAACIEQAHAGCRAALAARSTTAVVEEQGSEPNLGYEIVIADNGSSDGSPEIALAHGARVVPVEQKGYGAALLGGIAAARGKYIVMGDSDCSYDFGEVPRFIAKLEEGFDLVVGNRFAGGIMPGAMPWHHRYIGNPVLSGIGQLLYRTPCRDWHCGLRAFKRNSIRKLRLECTGMEFATEMVIRASWSAIRMSETPTILRPDGRNSPPHLRSIRDGFRHLATLLRLALIRIASQTHAKTATENLESRP